MPVGSVRVSVALKPAGGFWNVVPSIFHTLSTCTDAHVGGIPSLTAGTQSSSLGFVAVTEGEDRRFRVLNWPLHPFARVNKSLRLMATSANWPGGTGFGERPGRFDTAPALTAAVLPVVTIRSHRPESGPVDTQVAALSNSMRVLPL